MTPPHTAVNDVKPYIRNVPKGMVMLLTVEWPLVVQKKPHLPAVVDVGIFLVGLIVVLFDYFCIDNCSIQMCCNDNLLCKDPPPPT